MVGFGVFRSSLSGIIEFWYLKKSEMGLPLDKRSIKKIKVSLSPTQLVMKLEKLVTTMVTSTIKYGSKL